MLWAAFINIQICCDVGREVFDYAKDINDFRGNYGLPKRWKLHAEKQSVASQKAWMMSVKVQKHVCVAACRSTDLCVFIYCEVSCMFRLYEYLWANKTGCWYRLLQCMCVCVQHVVSCYVGFTYGTCKWICKANTSFYSINILLISRKIQHFLKLMSPQFLALQSSVVTMWTASLVVTMW
jgi:hypothetical protein